MIEELWKKIPKEIRVFRKWIEFGICFVLALPDIVGASLPVVGDIWDVIVIIILGVMFQNFSVLAMAAEFAPVVIIDLLPLELVPWVYKYYWKKKGKK